VTFITISCSRLLRLQIAKFVNWKGRMTSGFIEDAELIAEAVVDTIHESLLILDADLRVKLVNRGFHRTFHVRSEAAKNCLVYELGNGEWDIPELRRLLEDILPNKSRFDGFEVSHDFPQIGQKVMMLNARKLERRESQAPLILLAIEDITERKKAEDAVRRSNAELSDFAHVVAHDLQAPIRTVTLYAQLLAKKYKGRLDESADEMIRFIVEGGAEVIELIRSLLNYAVSTESEPEGREPLSLQDVFSRAVENLRLLAEETKAEITSDSLPTITGYSAQLIQLFQNLIVNAIKYHKPGIAPRIHVSATENPEEWRISVQDNGVGIAPENHRLVFAPRKRLQGPKISGLGIGLATCRKVVGHHGGQLWVDSELGSGATFHFTLPK